MTNNHSIYHDLNGQHVIVNSRVGTFLGVLEKDTHESIHLRPCVVHEPRLYLRDGRMESAPHYRLERQRPSILATMDISGVQPTTEAHIREIVDYESKPYEIKTPKQEGDKK
jgi:hypothetical protein